MIKGIVKILDFENNLIKKTSINKLKYREYKIIEESIKLFNDKDPCIIHRTYSINSIAFKLLEELNLETNNSNIIIIKTENNHFLNDYIEIELNMNLFEIT